MRVACCPGLVTVGKFVPPVAAVSHLQYAAAGVPNSSLVVGLRGFALERCWTRKYPGVLLLFVSKGSETVSSMVSCTSVVR